MALKFSYDSQADIPKGAETFYKELNGKWILDGEGITTDDQLKDARTKLNEFRTQNVALNSQIKAFEGKKVLTEEEATQYQELLDQREKNKDKTKDNNADVEALVTQRTTKMRTQYEAETNAAKKRASELEVTNKRYHGELEEARVQSALSAVLNDVAAPVKGAMQDIYSRARGTWRLNEEGGLEAVDRDGNPAMGADGKAMTMKEFAGDLVKTAPYLFENSKGGGGGGGKPPIGNKGVITIPNSNKELVNRNLEGIAKGTVIVDMDN